MIVLYFLFVEKIFKKSFLIVLHKETAANYDLCHPSVEAMFINDEVIQHFIRELAIISIVPGNVTFNKLQKSAVREWVHGEIYN